MASPGSAPPPELAGALEVLMAVHGFVLLRGQGRPRRESGVEGTYLSAEEQCRLSECFGGGALHSTHGVHPESPCRDIFRLSNDAQHGFIFSPIGCRLLRSLNASSARRCLADRHLLFYGDSLSRYLYLTLAHFLVHDEWPRDLSSYRDGSEACFCESSEVNFCDLSKEDIAAYVASGEPMDKAGAYGIQGLGGAFVTGIRGCYYNVMGFPMHRFCATLDVARLS